MNNKKSKNKIYKWVDAFFIFAPILLLVAYYVFLIFNSFTSGSNLKGNNTTYFTIDDYMTFLDNSLEYFFGASGLPNSGYNVSAYIIDYFFIPGTDNFLVNFQSLLTEFLFNLIGEVDTAFNFWYFITYYFVYIICYEFLTLFINIVLWLPRYIRSWIQERGVNV